MLGDKLELVLYMIVYMFFPLFSKEDFLLNEFFQFLVQLDILYSLKYLIIALVPD